MVAARDAWSVVTATIALLVYGVLQERVMTRACGSGNDKEVFPYSAFLVLCNRLLTVALLIGHSKACGLSFIPAAPIQSYCLVSASNMLSTLCQYEALKYVSFVTQTLAKTSKALPVILWGTIVGSRRYKTEQYVYSVLTTAGCSVFVLGGDITSAVADRHGTWWTYLIGVCLLLVYLAADGYTSTQQEHLFKTYNTCIREQLIYTTAFSTIYSLAATLAGNQLFPAVRFLLRHPDAAAAVLGLSAMSTIIQLCISHVLQQHGALVFALMMTTRQCASVLLSSLLFGHMLSFRQWLGIALVFSALYHQKSSKVVQDRRRSAAGRLPHSRQSAAGLCTPLLVKQPSSAAATAAAHRAISSSGLAGQPAVVHKHMPHTVSMGGLQTAATTHSHERQPGHLSQHHGPTLVMAPLQALTHGNGVVKTEPISKLHIQQAGSRNIWHTTNQGATAGPTTPHSTKAPAVLTTQLSLPLGLVKLWTQGGLHELGAGADAEQHTE